jgi:molybdopterin-biosynthesis enzyme MoeA-like protein
MQTDVLVLGGGSAGIAAAIAARKMGAQVTLIERHPFLGGMATAAMVGTFCGLYYRDPHKAQVATPGFPIEFATAVSEQYPKRFAENLWFLPYEPKNFERVALAELQEHEVRVHLETTVTEITKDDAGFRINGIESPTLIDCSGFAFASESLGLPTKQTETHQAGAIVFGAEGLPDMPTDLLRLALIREIKRGIREHGFSGDLLRLSIVPGTHKENEALLKLGMPLPFSDDEIAYEKLAREYEQQCLDALHRYFPDLKQTVRATRVGVRSSKRPLGDTVLTELDVLACNKPDDGVAIGACPIEFWGKAIKPEMVYFDPHDHYTIPAGCLQTVACPGLFFAGRNISADERALASARVMGTCLGTGYAAGQLAAQFASVA